MNQKNIRHRHVADSSDGDLFDAIIQRVRQSGDLDHAAPILDFCRSCAPETEMELEVLRAPHEFDFVPSLIYGTNEGIYLDCRLVGKFNGYGQYSFRIGVMKTLGTGIDTCKIMGELCGALMYHARKYMNEQIYAPAPRMVKSGKRVSSHQRTSAVSQ